jgi:hypothetical protein
VMAQWELAHIDIPVLHDDVQAGCSAVLLPEALLGCPIERGEEGIDFVQGHGDLCLAYRVFL